jgi:putative flippase GtrA
MIVASVIKFFVVGVANTVTGLAVIWCARYVLGCGDALANISGYLAGILLSFCLNRRWTFSFSGNSGAALLRFLLVFALSYAANLASVLSLIALTGSHSFWFQVYGAVPYSVILFLGCRWYVFAGRESPAARGHPPQRIKLPSGPRH